VRRLVHFGPPFSLGHVPAVPSSARRVQQFLRRDGRFADRGERVGRTGTLAFMAPSGARRGPGRPILQPASRSHSLEAVGQGGCGFPSWTPWSAARETRCSSDIGGPSDFSQSSNMPLGVFSSTVGTGPDGDAVRPSPAGVPFTGRAISSAVSESVRGSPRVGAAHPEDSTLNRCGDRFSDSIRG